MDTPNPRMKALIGSLLEQTQRGAIGWRQTDLPNSFAYIGKEGSVVVRGPSGDGQEAGRHYGVSLQVLDSGGERIEEFSSVMGTDGPLELLFREVQRRFFEGSPLLETLRREVEAARPTG